MADNSSNKVPQSPPDPKPNNLFDPKKFYIDIDWVIELIFKTYAVERRSTQNSHCAANGINPTDTQRANQHKPTNMAVPTTNRTNSHVAINQSGNVVNGNCEGPLINGNVHAPILTGGQHTTQNYFTTTPREKVIVAPSVIVQRENDDAFERRHRYDKKQNKKYYKDKYGGYKGSKEKYHGDDSDDEYDRSESSDECDGCDGYESSGDSFD